MGVLSALPIVSVGNVCCCLWVVSGGLVASYLLQQEQSTPIKPGEGAMVGLLAGLVGAAVVTLVSIPIDLLMSPVTREWVQQLAATSEMPPWVRDMLDNAERNEGSVLFFILGRLAAFVGFVVAGAIFSTLGGLLGAVLFSRRASPPAIDQPFG